MRLILFLFSASLFAAEAPKPDPKPTPTVEQQLAAKDAQIDWLTKRLAIVEARAKAIADYYAANEALRANDAAKPIEPKPEPKK